MNPSLVYRQHRAVGGTLIEALLSAHDDLLCNLGQALAALEGGDSIRAMPSLLRSQFILAALASGLDLSQGELPWNLLRLYEYALYCLGQGSVSRIASALDVSRTLREGLEDIRAEAIRFEVSKKSPRPLTLSAFHLIA
jgi:flagellin-specific chaperone FliS